MRFASQLLLKIPAGYLSVLTK